MINWTSLCMKVTKDYLITMGSITIEKQHRICNYSIGSLKLEHMEKMFEAEKVTEEYYDCKTISK